MENVTVNSEELEKSQIEQTIDEIKNYKREEEAPESIICNCMRFTGRSGRTYSYRGIASGCVRAVFSRGGVVTSISGNIRIINGRNYNFTHLPGEQLGFQCC